MALNKAQALFQRRLSRVVLFPILLLAGLSGVFVWQISRLLDAMQWVEHTDQVITRATQVQKLLLDIETGGRGYLLTGEQLFLGPYEKGMNQIDQAFSDLEALVVDNSEQQQRVVQLRQNQARWKAEFSQILSKQLADRATLRAFLTARKRQMDRMRQDISNFISTEEQLRTARSQSVQTLTRWVIGTTISSALLLGSILAVLLRSQLLKMTQSYRQALETAQAQTLTAQQSNQRLMTLHEIDQAILGADSLNHLSEIALARLQALISYDQGAVLLFQAEPQSAQVLATRSREQAEAAVVDHWQSLPLEILQYREPVWVISDLKALAQSLPFLETLLTQGYRSCLAAPLLAEAHLVGALLLVATPTAAFSREAQEVTREVANQLAIAIQQTRLRSQLQATLTDLEQRVADRTAELAQSNDRLAQLAAIVESSDDAIVSITLEGNILSWNSGAEILLGYSASEILGQSIDCLFPQTRSELETQMLNQIRQGRQVKHYEAVQRRQDGQEIYVSLAVSPIKNAVGEITGMSLISRDITDRKQVQEQLHLTSERISLANAELARAARLKDEFLAGMSHELRTPLNAILGLSEALLEEIFGELTDAQQEHLRTIEQSGQHLLDLINDILDLSKIESGKMELEILPVSIQALCDTSLSFVKQQAHHKRLKLDCQISTNVDEIAVDERRLRQALINLLSNAVKFTPEGGTVQLLVSPNSFHSGINFTVTDTGIGIGPDNLDKLFQPFVQLDSSLSRRYAGTGLGLALVRRIVELHGGSITLESELGQGSRFTISLPWSLPFADHLAPVLPEPDPIDLAPLPIQRALVIEDSSTAASQITRYLAELGTQAIIHPVAGGAVQKAREVAPDVIILDILLPDRSGWDVLTDLKANPETRTIPVIVISVVDERLQGMRMGASAYLLKPISRQKLQQVLSLELKSLDAMQEAGYPATCPLPPMTSPLILVAEDNEANIITLMSYLQAHRFQVILARNGLEAVQMARQNHPDIILMDVQMPEMDGLEATRRLRLDTATASIPIIALTALAMPGDRERCLAAGAMEYLTKPVSWQQLMQLLKRHIPASRFPDESPV